MTLMIQYMMFSSCWVVIQCPSRMLMGAVLVNMLSFRYSGKLTSWSFVVIVIFQRCYLMSWQNSSFDVHMLLKIFFCFQWIYCSSHPKVCLGLLCGCCIFNQDAIFYWWVNVWGCFPFHWNPVCDLWVSAPLQNRLGHEVKHDIQLNNRKYRSRMRLAYNFTQHI